MNKYYSKFRDKCFEVIGRECAKCKSLEDLQIDHIDCWSKSFAVSSRQSPKHWSLVKEELKKCQALCKTCHHEKSKKDSADKRRKDRDSLHGTESQYARYKCRCSTCKAVHNEWRRQHRLKIGETKRSYKPKI